jgi:hypothetical protein
MSGGDAGQRIDVAALKVLSGRSWGASMEYRLLRRQGEGWVQIGLFGSASLAGEAVDQAVGRGEGKSTDYRVEEIRVPDSRTFRWVKRILAVALFLASAIALGMIVAIFLQ